MSHGKFLSRTALLFALALVLALSQVNLTEAGTPDGINWSVGCEGFTSQGGGFILDRDNTGREREAFTITATDGAGNTIFGPLTESLPVGVRFSVVEGATFLWTARPAANPLTVSVTSLQGNGLRAQEIYTTSGTCDSIQSVPDLVTLLRAALVPLELRDADGTTSPTVPLNAEPPRPSNPPGVAATVGDGYLIVDGVTANLRSGPDTAFTVVGRVEGSTELIVLGRNAERTWWYVQVGDILGWISNEVVFIRGNLLDVPEVQSSGEILPPRFITYADGVLRAAPSDGSLVICTIEGNLEYPVIGKNPAGTWFEVVTPDCVGWIVDEAGAIRNSGDLPIPITD